MKNSILKMISMLTMSAMVIGITGVLPTSAATESITFARYDCINETFKSDYTLTTSDADATSTQSRVIIGDDTRVRTGHNGIVQLTTIDENGDYDYGATGFIVGDHVIACAAHCVYITEAEYADTDYFVAGLYIKLLDEDGTHSSLTPIKVKEIHVEANYIDNSDYDYTLDYALLTVSEDLSDYTQFNLGIAYDVNSPEFSTVPLYLSGMRDNTVYTGAGQESPIYDSTDTVLFHTCDSIYGQSGSPVYTAISYTTGIGSNSQTFVEYTALAINVAGISTANYGLRFTPTRLKFFRNNSYISY